MHPVQAKPQVSLSGDIKDQEAFLWNVWRIVRFQLWGWGYSLHIWHARPRVASSSYIKVIGPSPDFTIDSARMWQRATNGKGKRWNVMPPSTHTHWFQDSAVMFIIVHDFFMLHNYLLYICLIFGCTCYFCVGSRTAEHSRTINIHKPETEPWQGTLDDADVWSAGTKSTK